MAGVEPRRSWVPDFARGDQELWSPKLVLSAYVFALRVSRAVPEAIGPRGDRAYWPDISPDEEAEPDAEEDRLSPSRRDITRAEWVLVGFTVEGKKYPAWLNGALLGYPQQRKLLSRWLVWASHGKRTPDGIGETEEEFARRLRVSLATLKRQKDFAAAIIAQSLNEAGLPVWHAEKPSRKRNLQAASSG